jgi:hypothetical protein
MHDVSASDRASKPVQLHPFEEVARQHETSTIADDGIDAALRTESGLPFAIRLIGPVLNL